MATKTHMKNHIIHPFLLPALIAVLNLIPAGRATAQAFRVLPGFDGTDGANPLAGLITNSSGNVEIVPAERSPKL